MKDIFKLFHKAPKIARKMITINIIFSLSILAISAIAFYFAEKSSSYYCAREMSFELIAALRSCCAIFATGTVITAYLENKKQ